MKIKLTLKLTLFSIILTNFLCYSQQPPKIIQPTPEAANLTKYADVPVSLYTGKPQINFPLYTLKCGSLELPISLSYYASGVRVEDYPTWAGIGWALNAGGVITKITSDNGTHLSYDLPASGTVSSQYNTLQTFTEPHAVTDVIYNYNFLQYSGSFQMGKVGPVFRKHANLKIEIVNFNSITMTDDKGIKYYFELKGNQYGIQTDFYLVKMESADKSHAIYFEYIPGDSFGRPPHNSVFYTIYPGVSYAQASQGNYEIKPTGLLLSKIYTSTNNSVEFLKKDIAQLGSENSVFHHRKALDYINVYNHNLKIQSFHFKTNNIQTIKPKIGPYSDQFPVSNWDNKAMNYRLYLDGFEKLDSGGNIVESYGFEYYGRTGDGKDSLPSQYSLAQDLGGYYNGQDNNTSLIPPLNESLMPDGSGLSDKNNYNDNFVVNVNIPGANRNPDLQYMKMGTLKNVKYPTGGSANFYYSQMQNPLTSEPFFGLKIDKIEYLDSNGSLQKKKQYMYQYPVLSHPIPSNWHYTLKFGNNGLMTPFPTGCDVINGSLLCDDYNSFNSWIWAIELSPDSVYNQGLDEGPMIGYGLVKEFEEGNGHIDYEFSTDGAYDEEAKDHYFEIYRFDGLNTNTLVTQNAWPLGPFGNYNWKMGTLLNKATYDENGLKKQDVRYQYSYEILDRIPGINLFGVPKFNALGTYIDHSILYYQYFAYLSIWEKLDSVTETIDGVTKVTSYSYDNHKQVSQIKTTKSNGDLLTTNLTHSYDYPSSPVYSNMVTRNILAPVIEQIEKTNSNQTKLLKTNYSFWDKETSTSNIYIPSNNITSNIYPLSIDVKSSGSPIETRLNYNKYDNKGSIISVSKANDVETTYIWGYDTQYPIAKIENATYSQVSSYVANLQALSNTGTEANLITALNTLRTSLPNAMITTYTHIPLVGVSTMTDPKGETITYTYDTAGRLQFVKDKNGNILSENQYHYKN